MTSAWAELLEPVATDWLNECYLRAIRSFDAGQPFKATLIFQEWRNVVESGEFDRSRIGVGKFIGPGEKLCEFHCSVEGWITVDQNGFVCSGSMGATFAKPCPIHRPQGWQIGNSTDRNYQGFIE